MRVWLEASWARNCSRVHCVAGLSTLPDNPGDSRFWTISPGLQIRVWNLPDNRRSLPFLVRFDFRKMKFQIFCLIWAILLLILNVFSQIPVCRCNISNQCDWWEVNQLGQMLQFQQLLFRAYFSQMTSCAVHYDVIYPPFPGEGVGGWQPCIAMTTL